MEEKEPDQTAGEATQPDSDEPKEFDPQEIESDPSRNPPIDELNDLKGG